MLLAIAVAYFGRREVSVRSSSEPVLMRILGVVGRIKVEAENNCEVELPLLRRSQVARYDDDWGGS